MKPINLQTEYTTRSGLAVRLTTCSGLGGSFKVHGIILGAGGPQHLMCSWSLEGNAFNMGEDRSFDLIEVVEMKMKPINMQAEYTTRDGRAVEIRSITGTGLDTYPVIGVVAGYGKRSWTIEGKSRVGQLTPHDLIEAVETKPVMFGDMTDADKGVLLLAQHEGKELQFFNTNKSEWTMRVDRVHPLFDINAYRIAPMRISGTVEVDADGEPNFDTWVAT